MQDLSFQHYLLGLFAVSNNIPAIPRHLMLIAGLTRKEQNKLYFITFRYAPRIVQLSGISGAFPKM